MRSILKIFALVAVFLLTACAGNQPKDVAEDAAQCIQKKDFKGLVELMAKNGENTQNDRDLFVNLLEEKVGSLIDRKNGIKSYVIGEEVINTEKGTASVQVKFNYGDGSSKEDTLKFSKKEGVWYLVL